MHESAAIEHDHTEVLVTKRKNRNSAQQIIYVMPGPDQWLNININVNSCRYYWDVFLMQAMAIATQMSKNDVNCIFFYLI